MAATLIKNLLGSSESAAHHYSMHRIVRAMTFRILRFSGLPFLFREVWQRNKVTIVVYHAIEAERAARHFAVLQSRYTLISLSQLVAARSADTTSKLPSKCLIITLDDGHKINYELLPVLRRLSVPVTIFLCGGIVGTNRHYWWSHAKDVEDAKRLKAMTDEERAEALVHHGHSDVREYNERQALSRSEIAEMESFVDFQSHTVFHPILPACSYDKASWEISESKKILEAKHGLKIYALAYPNGDYSDREVELLQCAGYSCGLTLDSGSNDVEANLFRLRRVALPDDAGIDEVLVKTSGLWAHLKMIFETSVRRSGRIRLDRGMEAKGVSGY